MTLKSQIIYSISPAKHFANHSIYEKIIFTQLVYNNIFTNSTQKTLPDDTLDVKCYFQIYIKKIGLLFILNLDIYKFLFHENLYIK